MSVILPLRIVYQPLPGDLVTRFQAAWRETAKQGCEQEVSSVIALKAAPRVAHRHLFLSLCLPPLWPIPGLTRLMDSLGLSSFELTVTQNGT